MLIGSSVVKKYGNILALDGASICIERGKLTAVIGRSGSGKSTLHRVMSFLEPPDAGEITLKGESYKFLKNQAVPDSQFWPTITVVFQNYFLWPHLTLRKNIRLPLVCNGNLSTDEVNTRVQAVEDLFEMGGFIDRYPNEVSGGQRQRAALARALALEPEFLLLDEITSALDVEQSATIYRYLQLLKERGVGISLVTHSFGFIRENADHVVVLDSGRVVESGTGQILSHPESQMLKNMVKDSWIV